MKRTLTQRIYLLFLLLMIPLTFVAAQTDSLRTYDMEEFAVTGIREREIVVPLSNVNRTFIVGGRKSEVIQVSELPGNVAEKTGRQVFARVPGAFVYDMDGSGNQVNLSVRGLDAHRSWEFNVRQNNIITNTDMYGYPASHYSTPMEAVERIELVRGTGALQYGQQFGGMLNYVLKSADTTKVFSFENLTTVGSYGLFSNFSAGGGRSGKWTYYAYYQKRVSDGYRDNSRSDSDAQHFSLQYDFSSDLTLKAEVSRSTFLYQIPGPLNDEMFAENPRMATRFRNFYSPDIVIPALTLDWKISPKTHLLWTSSGVFGTRSSVEFPGNAILEDTINPETNNFAARNVGIHYYNSRTTELRVLHQYELGRIDNNLSVSVRYFNNDNQRNEQGIGTTGTTYDLSVPGGYRRELNLQSSSIAVAVENQFNLTDRFSVSPGLRYEKGDSDMTGRIDYLDQQQVPHGIPYDFLTLGVHAQYVKPDGIRIFGGISQANRPVLFQDLVPGDPFARIASDLTHSFGYNAELGFENYSNDRIQYNLTFFRTFIGNRVGNLIEDVGGQTYVVKSNIGDSMNDGVELSLDYVVFKSDKSKLSINNASSYMNGRYVAGTIRNGNENTSIVGNRIEAVPNWIIRSGLTFEAGNARFLLQHQYVSSSYADPLNTETPPANGSVGLVPSYNVWDFNTSYKIFGNYVLNVGVNNLFDKQYFTKRPTMYPGAGIWPSDGRSIVASLRIKI